MRQVLSLNEEGSWERPYMEGDADEVWVPTGLWVIRSYEGTVIYRGARTTAVEWLKHQGYRECADGVHFEHD